jgi:hypothetical protein
MMVIGGRIGFSIWALALLLAACARPPAVPRVLPGVTPVHAELSESALDAIVICHDTLGRPAFTGRVIEVTKCSPCAPYGTTASADRSRLHGRRLWQQGARAPYDENDAGAECARLAYRVAQRLDPENDALAVERALVEMASHADSVRARAIQELDARISERRQRGERARAQLLLTQLALGIWDRAQRQLERPKEIRLDPLERDAHDLARGVQPLMSLPPIPPTSSQLGVSEAQWAARLFEAAAQHADGPAERSRWLRLSLAPWVVLEAWTSLDSAALVLLRRAPNDSAVLPARALSAYRRMQQPVVESPVVMALFDRALGYMPRVDSARYDSFDGMLSAADDDWRYGFFPDQRLALEQRGWSVLDPLWSTPYNEIQLERRARVAEADYRYADLVRAGEAGSETKPGQMMVRRGTPEARWSLVTSLGRRQWLQRGWNGLVATSETDEFERDGKSVGWRIFYGPHFSLLHASTFATAQRCRNDQPSVLYDCAMVLSADWRTVPFYGKSDAVDVTVARFRARGDSADVYVGARVPLRGFKHRDDLRANPTDRIAVGIWLTDELGRPVRHASERRPLPASNTVAWTAQWLERVGSLRLMHRVEAMEPTLPSGARGVARFASDELTEFPLRGFGMSDILVAESAVPRRSPMLRHTDLTIQPNGGTVPPAALFSMVWEVYNLTPDRNGQLRWRVRVKRERGTLVVRADMKDVMAGSRNAGTRVISSEDSASDISYTRQSAANDVVLEHVRFGLGRAPQGVHVVGVTIDDLVSGRSVTRAVSVRVVSPNAQRRGTRVGAPPTPLIGGQ